MKELKGTFLRGLTSILLSLPPLATNGCAYHSVFRNNEMSNGAQLLEDTKLNYENYDAMREYVIVNNRAYPRGESPVEFDEEIIQVSPLPVKRLREINATYIESPDGNIIMNYACRIPPSDLQDLIKDYLPDGIKVEEFPTKNMLIFSGKKESFNENNLGHLSNLINQFDIPPEQIRIRLRIVEYFADNTYDRDLSLNVLKDLMPVITSSLPSSLDTNKNPNIGTAIHPFNLITLNTKRLTFEGAIKFLDSYGKTNTLADLDLLTSNGRPTELKNQSSIPYPETQIVGNSVLETLRYRDIGLDAKLIPFANEEGFITIKVEKAESGEQTGFSGTIQRPIFRLADLITEINVMNGLTYFVASSNFTRYKSVNRGIPGVNKVPVIGDVTTSSSIENIQSQLLYFIEARVMDRRDRITGIVPSIRNNP
ncbi:MAG: hypothetical protein QW727_01695 [Candidatus Pacearchaeota archaeon]